MSVAGTLIMMSELRHFDNLAHKHTLGIQR